MNMFRRILGKDKKEPVGYVYQLNRDNSFTILLGTKTVYVSRIFRLPSQTVTKAKEWIANQTLMDYTYKINHDNSFTVFHRGAPVFDGRVCRLKVQAERLAKEKIQELSGQVIPEGITLDVQSVSVDPNVFFGGR